MALETVEMDVEAADRHVARLGECGISMCAVTPRLLDDGIAKFVEPYDALLDALSRKRGQT